MAGALKIELGVKSDPIEYRYSFEWLFRVMAEEGVRNLQAGSFFELYQLPNEYFLELRRNAAAHGVAITSMFTAHRELGGFYRVDPRWEQVARRNYERFIEVGGLLGARSVGSNPGATLRDAMQDKDAGTACYLRNMKELMAYAPRHGVECLTVEPMSCLAEPPTLPEEMAAYIEPLRAHRETHPDSARPGLCADTSHGYADAEGVVRYTHMELLEASLPYVTELHVKNTDEMFDSTFGFTPEERGRGIVDLAAVRALLEENANRLPQREIIAYLEIGGPKLGRDYSDPLLERHLRESLRHMAETLKTD